MAHGSDRTLILVDGDVAGLVACAVVSERAGASGAGRSGGDVLVAIGAEGLTDSLTRSARQRAALAQAEHYDLRFVGSWPGVGEGSAVSPSQGHLRSASLLWACQLARAEGAGTIVRPVFASIDRPGSGLNLDDAIREADRGILAARLDAIDSGGGPRVQVESPFVDLSDPELAELADDLDVPMKLCWWWHDSRHGMLDDPVATAAGAARARWRTAMETLGLAGRFEEG